MRRSLERKAVRRKSIQELSRTTSKSPERRVWRDAAGWKTEGPQLPELGSYLAGFGYEAATEPCPGVGKLRGPELRLGVGSHVEHSGHTWYIVNCALLPAQGVPMQWEAPRRLRQIRYCLYDGVRKQLGSAYAQLFAEAPFANRGGPSGTTLRLRTWLACLATIVNDGSAPPSLVGLVLEFFQAPSPDEERATAEL